MNKLARIHFLIGYFVIGIIWFAFDNRLSQISSYFVLFDLFILLAHIKLFTLYRQIKKPILLLFWLSISINITAAFITLLAIYAALNIAPMPLITLLSAITCIILLLQSIKPLSDNIFSYHRQIKKQQKAFKTEKAALENILQESQDELESKVQERTLELHIALQELEELNRELAEKSTIDDLTQLYNRRFYDQKILAEYRRSRRNLTPLSLVVVDIDHFKKVNDTYGHIAGDECLKRVAVCIKNSLHRSSDIACRYGGEEFCLIMPETSEAGALTFANELRLKVTDLSVHYDKQHIPLTISCGVVTYQQQEGVEPATLFTAADQALYQAKQQGRNQVQLADATLLKTS